MSSITERAQASVPDGAPAGVPSAAHEGTIRRVALLVSVLVAGWSAVELVSLGLTHTTGPELYGVLAAGLATAGGVANLALLRSARTQILIVVAVVVIWAVVALGGIAGTVAHIVGPPIGEGPIDPRPRPVAAPLIFTLLGLVGGAALLAGKQAALRSLRSPWKE